jgi:hypothetical protein
MSVFSNRADAAAEQAPAYIDAVLGLLGDRDPVSVLASTVAFCVQRTAGLGKAELRTPEAPGKWSVVALLQHWADSELVWGYRLRRVLAEDRPELTGFDQDLWAQRLGYADADWDGALSMFAALREANLRLLEGATPQDLEREGVHVERGPESVRHMMRLYAGHDLAHRRQLERIIRAIGGDSGG